MRSHLLPAKVVMCGSPKLRQVIMVTVGDALGASVRATIGDALGAADGDALGEALGDALGDALGVTLGDALGDGVSPARVGAALGEALGDVLTPSFHNAHAAGVACHAAPTPLTSYDGGVWGAVETDG